MRVGLACVAMLNDDAVMIDIMDETDFELSLLSPLHRRYRRPVASGVLP